MTLSLRAGLDSSRAAKTDRHLATFDDQRDRTAPAAHREHLGHSAGIGRDVLVDELDVMFARVRRPGVARVGSSVFAVDNYRSLATHAHPPRRERRIQPPPRT